MTVRLHAEARDELASIIEQIEDFSLAAADKVERRLLAAMEELDWFPLQWPATVDPAIRMRVLPDLPYLIYYRVKGEREYLTEREREIVVLHVWDGRRGHRPF